MVTHFDVIVLTAIPLEWQCAGKVFGVTLEDAHSDEKDPVFAAQLSIPGLSDSNPTHVIGRNVNVGIFCAVRAGNHRMAAVVADLIVRFQPQLAMLVGISAGKKTKDVEFGDVIVPGMILDFSTVGAHADIGETPPDQVVSEAGLASQVKYALRNVAFNVPDRCILARGVQGTVQWAEELCRLKIPTPTRLPKILDGVLASANVLSRAEPLLQMLSAFNEQVRGMEMESAGFGTACERAGVPWIVGKAICDWGDEDKTSRFHEYAAYTSAIWARSFIVSCFSHNLIFSHQETLHSLFRRHAVQSMLALVGAKIESANPRLKMNIQLYKLAKIRGKHYLVRERGLCYRGDPGIRSRKTETLARVEVKPESGRDLCICIAARRERKLSKSSVSKRNKFYFAAILSKDQASYPEDAKEKVSPKQKWVVAFRMGSGSCEYVVSHSGSNELFCRKDGPAGEISKTQDAEKMLPHFEAGWKHTEQVLVNLLRQDA